MNATEFFYRVLPSVGYIIIGTPIAIPGQKTSPFRHHLHSEVEAAAAHAANLSFEHENVFFALAGYREERVWNPNYKNRDGSLGKWQTRTQANAGWLKSLFLDLDVDPNPDPEKADKVFPSKEAAATALKDFRRKVGLPAPMVLDSGGGLHVYWPLSRDMERDEWQVLANRLKNICVQEQLAIDPAVPADAARVLRVLGCPNLKRDHARPVTLLTAGAPDSTPESIATVFELYEQQYGVAPAPRASRKVGASPALASPFGASNVQKDFSPINFGLVSFACGVIGGQVATGGKGTTEPLWRACIGLARFATDPEAAMLSVSDQHADFDPDTMHRYAERWNAGPTTCDYFNRSLNCTECASCPHFGKITSPAQLGNTVIASPPPMALVQDADTGLEIQVELPDPPAPYVRRTGKHGVDEICIRTEDKDGVPYYIPVCPNDIYPERILRSTIAGEVMEKTMWTFRLARMAPTTVEVPQGLISDTKALHKFLMNVGVYATASEAKAIQDYMSAYLKQLASQFDRERIFSRLGWQDNRNGFVAGAKLYNMDGSVSTCTLSQGARNAVKDGLTSKGDLSTWSQLVSEHYAGDEYRSHRFFLYCAFGAPLFHMTGHKGVLVTAAGKSGRGKTTVLKVGSSIWGHPEALILNGNPDGSTTNAMYNHLGTLHSLPMMWDDVTERDAEEMCSFALNISQGKGKERMKGPDHDGRNVSWETMVLSSANYDNIASTLATRKDAEPHLMRMVGVTFDEFEDTTEGKIAAERFTARIHENFGLAGTPFMQFVTKNYAAIKRRVEENMERVDRELGAKAHERFWTAVVATALTAGQIVDHLRLVGFPLMADYEWMKEHIAGMRAIHADHSSDPVEDLSSFLSARLGSTLVMSTKTTSNLDNIALAPHHALTIRHEMDKGLIFVDKREIHKHCAKNNIGCRDWENQLASAGVLLDKAKLKTLGADTKYANGQVRCWVLDAVKLGGQFAAVLHAAMANQNKVVPLQPTGT